MEIDIFLCIKATIIGLSLAVITLIVPVGNTILGVSLASCISTVINSSEKEEMLIIVCTFVCITLLNTIKEILDPALSGNEELAGVYISGYRWECLEVNTFQQIKESVESKIEGLLYGIVLAFILINCFHITYGSLNVTFIFGAAMLWKTFKHTDINNKTDINILIKSILYLLLINFVMKGLTNLEYFQPAIIVIYTFFLMPSIFSTLIKDVDILIKKTKRITS